MDVTGSIVFFDDDEEQRNLLKPRLEVAFGGLSVEPLEPYSTVGETVKYILEQSNRICAVVTDERMDETGASDFKGSELAAELRGHEMQMPIFILTSYADDEQLGATYN